MINEGAEPPRQVNKVPPDVGRWKSSKKGGIIYRKTWRAEPD